MRNCIDKKIDICCSHMPTMFWEWLTPQDSTNVNLSAEHNQFHHHEIHDNRMDLSMKIVREWQQAIQKGLILWATQN